MSVTTILAVYFILWWVVLFAVLPWGARSQSDSGEVSPGTEPGAPSVHRVGRALLWTTLIASLLFVVLWAVYTAGLIPFDWLMSISGPPPR
jgi:predicted secreted protein